MKVLIDTVCWLWALSDPGCLNSKARALLSDSRQEVFLSAASSWEIAIKTGLGKLRLPESPDKFIPSRMAALQIKGLPIEHAHALRVFSLPMHHRDPFDRILIAQALVENLTILTADQSFERYDVKVMWAK